MKWFIVILLAVLSAILLAGKGSFLIAGYNTAGEAKRSRYNEKKLCRIMGGGMGILAVFAASDAFTDGGFSSTLGIWYGVMTLLVIVVMIILANTICREKNPPAATVMNADSGGKWKKFSAAFTAAILILAAAMLFTGSVKVTVKDEILKVQVTYWPGIEIPYSKIESAVLAEDMHKGTRTNGLGSFRLSAGNWQNQEFGNYRIYAYARCKTYIILDVDGKTVVINGKDEQTTKVLLEEIERHIE